MSPVRASKALREALAKSSEFHGRPPRAIRRRRLVVPKALVRIGAAAQIDYVSDKWDGKLRRYFHEFGKMPEIYATSKPDHDGNMMLVLVGKFKIQADGIIG